MPTDVSGFDPMSVSMRDYVDGIQEQRDRQWAGHDAQHKQEHATEKQIQEQGKETIDTLLGAHEQVHALEKEAIVNLAALVAAQRTEDAHSVDVALEAVQRAAQIHAIAHEQQHHAHQAIHDVEKEAIIKATEQMDKRLYAMNEYRSQLRDQGATFVNIGVYNTKMTALERERDDARATQITLTTRLTSLEVGLATKAASGDASSRTAMAVIGFVITIVIAIVVILSNVLLASP